MAKTKNKDNVVEFPSKAAEGVANQPVKISRFFQAALAGLQAREREIERDHIAPLREDFLEFAKAIETEYKVKLGSTHTINSDGTLVPQAQAPTTA